MTAAKTWGAAEAPGTLWEVPGVDGECRLVPGYGGRYAVTSSGVVISKWLGWRPRKLYLNPKGYYCVSMPVDGRSSNRLVHRLVLEAFVGPRPDGMQGCHNDGDSTNNHISNLRWDTPHANAMDQVAHGMHYQANRTHCPSGHPYSQENTRIKQGRRRCRTCHNASKRRRRAEIASERAA